MNKRTQKFVITVAAITATAGVMPSAPGCASEARVHEAGMN